MRVACQLFFDVASLILKAVSATEFSKIILGGFLLVLCFDSIDSRCSRDIETPEDEESLSCRTSPSARSIFYLRAATQYEQPTSAAK